MWRTFLAELKHIFKHKWRIFEWIFIAFIPFFYGFFYMNAYWNPFSHTDNLRIAVVDLNKTQSSEDFKEKIIASGNKGVSIGSNTYTFDIKDATDIYKQVPTEDEVKKLVDNNEYQAVIIIDSSYEIKRNTLYTKLLDVISEAAKNALQGLKLDFSDLSQKITLAVDSQQGHLITFYNSIKHSYLAGEITNFGAGLAKIELDTIIPSESAILEKIFGPTVISQLLTNLGKLNPQFNINALTGISPQISAMIQAYISNSDAVNTLLNFIRLKDEVKLPIITKEAIGDNINTYGFGLSPYFICIALWAGALVMTFLIKNERHINNVSTFKHYFGKTIAWVATGWIQAIILITAITLQGVRLPSINQFELYLLALFISTIFTTTVQGIAYFMRYGDLGEFAAVILLVLQLTSSSGTFPVSMQETIFKIINPVVPFTYGIKAIREVLYEPQATSVLANVGILLIFPFLATSASLTRNYLFDKKTKTLIQNVSVYKSFEHHLGDF